MKVELTENGNVIGFIGIRKIGLVYSQPKNGLKPKRNGSEAKHAKEEKQRANRLAQLLREQSIDPSIITLI